jgi:hypothetical protein
MEHSVGQECFECLKQIEVHLGLELTRLKKEDIRVEGQVVEMFPNLIQFLVWKVLQFLRFLAILWKDSKKTREKCT